MGRRISATEARIHFGEVMRDAQEAPVVVERGGEPHVVVLSKRAYDHLLAQLPQSDWRDLLAEARNRVLADLGERELPPPEDLVREMRRERDEQLSRLR